MSFRESPLFNCYSKPCKDSDQCNDNVMNTICMTYTDQNSCQLNTGCEWWGTNDSCERKQGSEIGYKVKCPKLSASQCALESNCVLKTEPAKNKCVLSKTHSKNVESIQFDGETLDPNDVAEQCKLQTYPECFYHPYCEWEGKVPDTFKSCSSQNTTTIT